MATQADSSALSPKVVGNALTPEVVGNAFVEQYYSILHQSPDMVHKFYQESSMLSRPDASGVMNVVTTMKGINDQIISMDYQNFRVQILTADAQASYNSGVIVLVTGCLIGKDNVRTRFTQSFFLAPQDKGYFVLNDVFRYVDGMDVKEELVEVAVDDAEESAPIASSIPEPEPTHAPNHLVPNHTPPPKEEIKSSKEASHPVDNGKILVTEKRVVAEHPVVSTQNDARPVKEAVSSKTQEEAPTKSFASIVHELNKSPAPFKVIARAPAVKPEQPRAVAAPEASAPSSRNRSSERSNDRSVKGHTIFVANLPDTATVEQLKGIFEKFGPIKPDGIQVRSQSQKGHCFGFVQFESASSMISALEVSAIQIGNRRAKIEEKRGHIDGGRYPPGQGGYRENHYRGRGNFNEGRGNYSEGRVNYSEGRGNYRRNENGGYRRNENDNHEGRGGYRRNEYDNHEGRGGYRRNEYDNHEGRGGYRRNENERRGEFSGRARSTSGSTSGRNTEAIHNKGHQSGGAPLGRQGAKK